MRRAAAGIRPRACPVVYIWPTLCRFDDNMGLGLKQDHLFLVREGWLY